MPVLRLRQLVNFMRVFGLGRGARLWCSMKAQLARGEQLTLRVPGVEVPLQLRRQDLPIFDQILVDQEDDITAYAQGERILSLYRALLAEGKRPVILDCGGHVGFSAVWFASRFPEATVYSVEPEAANFALLQRNAAAYPNIVPLRGGVWSRRCQLRIINPEAISAAFRVREAEDDGALAAADEICGYTVDEILHENENNRLLLVKIDIEGAESEVFVGPTEWLASTSAVLIELHDWLLPGQGTSRNFFKRVAEYDFEVVPRGEKLLLFRVAAKPDRSTDAGSGRVDALELTSFQR